MDDYIKHYGTPRHSGRYPYGSGDEAYQRNKNFLGQVDALKKKGLSEVEIARGLGMTTPELRQKKTRVKEEIRSADYTFALKLKDKGYSNVAIGERMGINESSVRALLNPAIQQRSEMTNVTADILKTAVDKKQYIDVGVGVERYMGVSRTKLKTAISKLEEDDGYMVSYLKVEQVGTGKSTSVMVLSKPKDKTDQEMMKLKNTGHDDKEIAKKLNISEEDVVKRQKALYADVYQNQDKVRMVTDYSEDGGRTYLGLEKPKSIKSDRVMIRYSEDGGTEKDGVIELRRGVEDISLGRSKYAQVRIGVDDAYYMKGMAMYSDDIPKGYDIVYNTNKGKGVPKEKVFKEMKRTNEGEIDPDNPFGAVIKAGGQRHYKDKDGKDQLSVVNIVNEEGDWSKWSKTLSSQVLSKQTTALAKKQLELAYQAKKQEYDEIMSLTNPAVKKKLLDSFSDDCDSSAVHLKAAALPRQGSHVILPFPTMKETEIYAPNYNDGERVVLIRYPHGGIFEIPELTVNNRHANAKKAIGQAKDAVGINAKVAERLSGADFDGDTVLVIPNPNKEVKNSSPLKGLKDFDPKISYKGYEGMEVISSRTKQMKMGEVSNLITDMTIRRANDDEIARAVRHSMVVIDAEKHKLDYKRSYVENGIGALKKKYQGGERSGASTLISRASSDMRVGVRKERIDPETGKKIYEYTNETYIKRTKLKDGTIKETPVLRTVSSSKMAEVDDAFKLSSGTPMEAIYATHANKLKALANSGRKESVNTQYTPYSPAAKKAYAKEVDSLKAKLNLALKNAPLERQAQILANSVVATKRRDNPDMTAEDVKKIKGQALAEARSRTGAGKQRIDISDREWEAIQAGAISTNTLSQILNNTDLDIVKHLATPRASKELSTAKQLRAKQMLAAGRTQAEIASALGVSTSLITKLIE